MSADKLLLKRRSLVDVYCPARPAGSIYMPIGGTNGEACNEWVITIHQRGQNETSRDKGIKHLKRLKPEDNQKRARESDNDRDQIRQQEKTLNHYNLRAYNTPCVIGRVTILTPIILHQPANFYIAASLPQPSSRDP